MVSKVILDLETSDPDDLMTLLFLGGHPRVDLRAVLVSPGTPAQLLLVDAALRMIHEERFKCYQKEACESGKASSLQTIPIGYFDLDLAVPNGGDNDDVRDGEHNPFRDTRGKIYDDLFPEWKKEVNRVFYSGKRTGEGPTATEAGKGLASAHSTRFDSTRPAHQRLKAYTMQKLAKAGREVDQGWKLLCQTGGEDVVLVTGGPVWNLGKAVQKSLETENGVDGLVVEGGENRFKPLKLHKWCAQGGFAGHNALVGMESGVLQRLRTLLPRFAKDTTNPAWNFDLSHVEVIAALEYSGIAERWICSKNVCHRVVYDTELHNEIGGMITGTSGLAAASGIVDQKTYTDGMGTASGIVDQKTYTDCMAAGSGNAADWPSINGNETLKPRKQKRWSKAREKRDVDVDVSTTTDGSLVETASTPPSVPKPNAIVRIPTEVEMTTPNAIMTSSRQAHPGLLLFHRMMDLYRRRENKKLHDLLPALCAIDPILTGCTFRQARLEWVRNTSSSDWNWNGSNSDGNHPASHGSNRNRYAYKEQECVLPMTKEGERVFPSPIGRWKNGGEWGCVGGVGEWVDFSDASIAKRSNTKAVNRRAYGPLGSRFNVWISVDVNIESFRRGLVS